MTPNSKVTDGVFGGGAIGIVAVWLLVEYAGIMPTPEVAVAMGSIISGMIAYLLPERRAK